jgi:hypothetical protein
MLDRLIAAVRGAIADILNSSSGFGHAAFEVVDGELVPRQITITHHPRNGESFEVFIARLKTTEQWHDGDLVEFVYNKHRLQLVRITRNPPRAPVEPT